MIYIQKGTEPQDFTNWKQTAPNPTYEKLINPVKTTLRNSLLQEQGFICCFCGCSIGLISDQNNKINIIQCVLTQNDPHNIRNAHITPRSIDPNQSLDYNNICASCESNIEGECHCDSSQGNLITPLQQDCLSFFSFSIDRSILPNTNKTQAEQNNAQNTIDILKLNTPKLKSARKDSILRFTNIIKNLSNADRANYIKNLSKKDSNGIFAPYFFVPLRYYNFM